MPKDTLSNKKNKKDVEDIKDEIEEEEEELEELDVVKIEDESDEEDHPPVHEAELDEEVLQALNIKPKKKPTENIDYVPELDRDFDVDY